MKPSTILVTGASGYLGSRVTRQLLAQGHRILAATPNLQDVPSAHPHLTVCTLDKMTPAQIFDMYPVDGIIHFATCYGRGGQDAAKVAQINLLLPLQLLAQAVAHRCTFFVNTDTILQPNLNPYALTKHQFAQWLEFYAGNLKAVNMRLDHFYGPHDHPVKFIAWLVEKFKSNAPFIDLTEGTQLRDFIYIDDVVNAYVTVLNALDGLSTGKVNHFEVGSGTKTSIKDMVLLLQRLMNKPHVQLNFGAVPYRPHEKLDYIVDISALRALGWQAQVQLEAGLQRIIKEEQSAPTHFFVSKRENL